MLHLPGSGLAYELLRARAALHLAAPGVEAVGWLALALGGLLGFVSLDTALFFIACSIGLGVSVSLAAILLDVTLFDEAPAGGQKAGLVALAFLEQIGIRPLSLWWQLRAWLAGRGRQTAAA